MLENLYPNETNGHMEDIHDNVMNQNGGSVWVLDSLNENRIFNGRLTYDKGAAIIHTMRYMINDDAQFFQLLKDFQSTHGNGTAYGVDFKNAMESASGEDFNTLFEQWYFGEGYPTYSLQWQQLGNDLIVEISHTTSKPNVTPTFTNDLDVRFVRPGQSDTIVRFDITSNSNIFTLSNFGAISASISIDPQNWIINKLGSIIESNSLNLHEEQHDLALTISPNPNQGEFKISNLKEKVHIVIYDLHGKTRKHLTISPEEYINIKELGKGTYIVEIQTNKNSKRFKILSY
jgi:hypothetical protein